MYHITIYTDAAITVFLCNASSCEQGSYPETVLWPGAGSGSALAACAALPW